MKVALISYSKRKLKAECVASDMYMSSNIYTLSNKYAKHIANIIYILTPKYGLLSEDDNISPYDFNLGVSYRITTYGMVT